MYQNNIFGKTKYLWNTRKGPIFETFLQVKQIERLLDLYWLLVFDKETFLKVVQKWSNLNEICISNNL